MLQVIVGKTLETALETAQLTDVKEFEFKGGHYKTEDYQTKSYVVTDKKGNDTVLYEHKSLAKCAEYCGVDRSTLYRNKIGDGVFELNKYMVIAIVTIEEGGIPNE